MIESMINTIWTITIIGAISICFFAVMSVIEKINRK